MMFSVNQAASMLGVKPLADSEGGIPCMRVSTDTRDLQPGDLFIALKGANFNGHDYISAAAEKGAAAVVVSQIVDHAIPQLLVDDTRQALARLATAWRRQFQLPVISVSGSNGKTTTKEMISAILAEHVGEEQRLATRMNFNNDIGVAMTVLRLRQGHRFAVIEVGMNHPGETKDLAAIVQPTIALVNNALREHQEFMRSVEGVAHEHAHAIDALPVNGRAIFPADDRHSTIWRAAAGSRQVVDFALEGSAAVTASVLLNEFGAHLELKTIAGAASLDIQAAGVHNVRNALAATAVGLAADVPLDTIVRALSAYRPVAGRLCRSKVGAWTLIDDTYNANPDSVRAAIDVLATQAGPLTLVLGDMSETGDQGPEFHREVGEYARERGVDRLLAIGKATPDAVAAFGAGATHLDSVEAVAQVLLAERNQSQTILVKGSRFMNMERVVQALSGAKGA